MKDIKNIDNIKKIKYSRPTGRTKPTFNELKKYIDIFKHSHDIDKEYHQKIKGLPANKTAILFDELIENYYEILINAFKKLAKYNKKYTNELVSVYIEIWKISPKLKDKDYFSPYLYDLCEFLFYNKELGKLTFFYNLMIFSREIPFLTNNDREKTENYLRNEHLRNNEEDPFEEFRRADKNEIYDGFNIILFNQMYEKFFQILNFWKERADSLYSKDEMFFMGGLFVLDELIDLFYIKNEKKLSEIKGFQHADKNKNIYNPIFDDKIYSELTAYYDIALEYFKKALMYNQCNPRYFYEYARCLKNSGRSKDAELFFKKALDLN